MKKLFSLAAVAVLVLSLAACGNQKLADGVYSAEADDAYVENYGYGWRDTLIISVQDGVVISGEFDSFDADHNRKSTPGNYEMTPEPSVWMPELSAEFTNAASPDDIDTIAGATIGSNNARQLFEAILKSGKPGETIEVSLDAPS